MIVTFEIPDEIAADVVEAMAANYDHAGYKRHTKNKGATTPEEFVAIACLKNCRDQLRSFVQSKAMREADQARKQIESAFPDGI